MGIVLRGENYNTDEVLGDIESFYGMFKKEYERVRDAENKAWKEYAAYKPQTQLNQLKLIYMDALRRGKPIEWAEGKAEGLGLEEEEIEIDEEFQYITELFNLPPSCLLKPYGLARRKMDLQLKCLECGGNYELSSKTRRRIVYKCSKCGRELPVRKKPKQSQKSSD